MKVLITGGMGFIGSAVIRHVLRNTDWQVVNLDLLTYAAAPEAVGDVAPFGARYATVKADIADPAAMRAAFADHQPDVVMHLAAESHVDRSIDGPRNFVRTNVEGTFTLLEAAREYHAGLPRGRQGDFRFHHVSTDEVYGSLADDALPATEDNTYRPNSPYSASKAASDHLVRAWGETFKLPVVTSNCSNNYGPWQFPEKLIPLMIAKMRQGQPLPVYGKGENIRDWLYVEDHARALCLILTKGRLGETYNIGGRAERRNLELVKQLCALMDARFPEAGPHERLISFVTDRPGHDLRYAIDAGKIERELGWVPVETIDTGLAKTLDWYMANEPWWRGRLAARYDGRRLGVIEGSAREQK